jgi:hypothetical protein
MDVTILRLSDKEIKNQVGITLHFEPDFGSELGDQVIGYFPCHDPSLTPLSDFYYRLVQLFYYTLDVRGYTYGDIGVQLMCYMSWATTSWYKVYKAQQQNN